GLAGANIDHGGEVLGTAVDDDGVLGGIEGESCAFGLTGTRVVGVGGPLGRHARGDALRRAEVLGFQQCGSPDIRVDDFAAGCAIADEGEVGPVQLIDVG